MQNSQPTPQGPKCHVTTFGCANSVSSHDTELSGSQIEAKGFDRKQLSHRPLWKHAMYNQREKWERKTFFTHATEQNIQPRQPISEVSLWPTQPWHLWPPQMQKIFKEGSQVSPPCPPPPPPPIIGLNVPKTGPNNSVSQTQQPPPMIRSNAAKSNCSETLNTLSQSSVCSDLSQQADAQNSDTTSYHSDVIYDHSETESNRSGQQHHIDDSNQWVQQYYSQYSQYSQYVQYCPCFDCVEARNQYCTCFDCTETRNMYFQPPRHPTTGKDFYLNPEHSSPQDLVLDQTDSLNPLHKKVRITLRKYRNNPYSMTESRVYFSESNPEKQQE